MRYAFVLCLLVAMCLGAWRVTEPDAADHARIAREAQAAELAAERDAELAPLGTAATATAMVLGVLTLAAAAGWAWARMYLDIRRRAQYVLPTPDGRLPVPAAQLPAASVAALGALHARGQLTATEQPLDAALTWERETVAALLEG